jgi:alpha-D-xyloside xylohydrolase
MMARQIVEGAIMRHVIRLVLLVCLLASAVVPAAAQWTPMNPVVSVQPQADGLVLALKTGFLKIQVCSDSIVRIRYAMTGAFPAGGPDPVVIKASWPATEWKHAETAANVTLTTGRLKLTIDRRDAAINYAAVEGRRLVQDASRKLMPVTVNGEQTYRSEAFFNIYGSREGLYGLGQQQAGVWNHRGNVVDLSHDNSSIAVPFLVSSNGYGILWHSAARSRMNNRFANYLYLSSEVADEADYYFVYGPDLDRVVAGYRELTGDAPLFGKWAYGFWQCKNRYKTQAELLGVARKYRDLKIPVDNIVQDWFWWNRKGEHVFNSNYPDPKGMVDELHRSNFHFMISVWPFFEPGSAEYAEMERRGWFVDKFKFDKLPYHADGMAVYDATNADARKYYWTLMDKGLFKLGADAWWLDTTEPETEGQEDNILLDHKLAMGSGNRYLNLFSLLTTSAVYEGQRAASNDQRVYILSRSAFAGAQRNAVTAWSGDINSDWFSYRRQIPGGLNFSLSGLPYWTTDIGGFLSGGNPKDPAYRELFTRWFQYGTFCPIFRVHGSRDENELWSYGPETQQVLVAFDRLRYRMLPYIYSLAWKTTSERYTPMRPLVMDFRGDARAADIGDQFMYGPAFLVSPVTEPAATTRHLYVPRGSWYDFWTGAPLAGGTAIDARAPIDIMPVLVRAGSIVPLGPDIEWASQKAADPVELRVYRGANGNFTLYEDEGDTYNYEKGKYATIPLTWDEATRTLTIGDRKGDFPGMLQERTFKVVFVGAGHGVGIEAEATPDRVVKYAGKAVTVTP